MQVRRRGDEMKKGEVDERIRGEGRVKVVVKEKEANGKGQINERLNG